MLKLKYRKIISKKLKIYFVFSVLHVRQKLAVCVFLVLSPDSFIFNDTPNTFRHALGILNKIV